MIVQHSVTAPMLAQHIVVGLLLGGCFSFLFCFFLLLQVRTCSRDLFLLVLGWKESVQYFWKTKRQCCPTRRVIHSKNPRWVCISHLDSWWMWSETNKDLTAKVKSVPLLFLISAANYSKNTYQKSYNIHPSIQDGVTGHRLKVV